MSGAEHSWHAHLVGRTSHRCLLITTDACCSAYFHCQCNSDYTRAAVILASACELAQMMKLDDTSFSSNLAQDFRERELRKRVYWYLYAIDMCVSGLGYAQQWS